MGRRVVIKTSADVRLSNAERLRKKYNSGGRLTVGIHKKDNKKYPEGNVTTAQVGLWQEFGHTARGGRSFVLPKVWLRIFNLYEEHKKNLAEYAAVCFRNCDKLSDALKDIGHFMSETIKDRIRDNEVTPSSDKDGTTLIRTGEMINSIDFEVHDDDVQ